MNKIDALIAAGIGEITAIFFYFFFSNAHNVNTGQYVVPDPIRSSLWIMIVVFPILSVFCLWIASLIGRKYAAVFQLAKFLLVGAMASIFDLGTLAIFMSATGQKGGIWFIIFKSASFIISAVLKYFPDKLWAFKKTGSANAKKEFMQFFMITLASYVVNVGVASAINDIIGPQFNLDKDTWGSVAGMAGIIVAFTLNFVGYKFIAFKK